MLLSRTWRPLSSACFWVPVALGVNLDPFPSRPLLALPLPAPPPLHHTLLSLRGPACLCSAVPWPGAPFPASASPTLPLGSAFFLLHLQSYGPGVLSTWGDSYLFIFLSLPGRQTQW